MLVLLKIKRLNLIATELLIRGSKLNIYIVFITQSYFKVPKDVRLNTTHFLISKIPNRRELKQIAINIHQILALKISKISIENVQYSFFVNDTTLASDNP